MNKNVRKYKFKNGLPFEFEIISVSDLYLRHKNLLVLPHRAEFYNIIWNQNGTAHHFVDFNLVNLPTNSILFVPKDCVNTFDNSGEYDGKIILFTDEFFYKSQNDIQFLQSTILFNDPIETTIIKVHPKKSVFHIILEMMEREVKNPNDTAHYDLLRNLLHNFLLLADRERKKQGYKKFKPGVDLDFVMLFKNRLEKNFTTNKSVKKYAADLGITEKRLNNATSMILGKNPKQLIDDRVLLEAKRVLAYGPNSIKEISFDLGFQEPTNFIKYFKKHCDMTPSEFREKTNLNQF